MWIWLKFLQFLCKYYEGCWLVFILSKNHFDVAGVLGFFSLFILFLISLASSIILFLLPFLASTSSNNNCVEKDRAQPEKFHLFLMNPLNCEMYTRLCYANEFVGAVGKKDAHGTHTHYFHGNADSITVRGIRWHCRSFAFVSSFSIIDKSLKITSCVFFFSPPAQSPCVFHCLMSYIFYGMDFRRLFAYRAVFIEMVNLNCNMIFSARHNTGRSSARERGSGWRVGSFVSLGFFSCVRSSVSFRHLYLVCFVCLIFDLCAATAVSSRVHRIISTFWRTLSEQTQQ